MNDVDNEWYAKDTGKKIRAVFRSKGMLGQRLGTHAPYGYLKGEGGRLVVDQETAPVVRFIFCLCAEGNGPGKIARILRERQIVNCLPADTLTCPAKPPPEKRLRLQQAQRKRRDMP